MIDKELVLQKEWEILQQEYAGFEKWSLLIKVFSVVICSTLVFHQKLDFVIFCLCIVLWMLDAIWKTFQARTEQRILVIEQGLAKQSDVVAMQFHTHWQQSRPSAAGLIIEYVKSGLSPTVCLPHICVLSVCVLLMWWL
ncbi:hypothetical protein [Aliiglaciecola sp. M165]|uniref:hypothetical protein n=1 Tax=Aliiglaciecola sp. M165 TaxID=2593649 RepID=UPI0011810237|nr:hypothetical protein [Aliiglaciecola sp. M165]TRY33194.1 hypothetical protein FM019_04210 [Aliiglaciecola sp. M165]